MTAEEHRLFWRILFPLAVVIGIIIGLLPGDNIWVPVHP